MSGSCYTCGKTGPDVFLVSVPLQEDGPRRAMVCEECELKIKDGQIVRGSDFERHLEEGGRRPYVPPSPYPEASEIRRDRIASAGEELARRGREKRLDLAVQNAAMSGNWKMLRDVILDQGERLLKLERFAADLIADLEAKK